MEGRGATEELLLTGSLHEDRKYAYLCLHNTEVFTKYMQVYLPSRTVAVSSLIFIRNKSLIVVEWCRVFYEPITFRSQARSSRFLIMRDRRRSVSLVRRRPLASSGRSVSRTEREVKPSSAATPCSLTRTRS